MGIQASARGFKQPLDFIDCLLIGITQVDLCQRFIWDRKIPSETKLTC